MNSLTFVLMLNLIFHGVKGIWPPQYKVKLHHEEEFVISELLDREDVQDIYDEEELIKEQLKLSNSGSDKYFRLHNLVKKRNSLVDISENSFDLKQPVVEFNPEEGESHPWIGGFIDGDNNIQKDEDTIYFDDDAKTNKTLSEGLSKREADPEYNYMKLKVEYEEYVKKETSKNDTLKYEEIKEEETAIEAVGTLMDKRNCSDEEKSNIGSIRCFISEAQKQHLSKGARFHLLKKIALIGTIWFSVYVAIALPLWCQYGWCCCCCRCKICHPRDIIDEIKAFHVNNPPGIYHDDEGNLKKYKESTYEVYAQKKLDKAIQQL